MQELNPYLDTVSLIAPLFGPVGMGISLGASGINFLANKLPYYIHTRNNKDYTTEEQHSALNDAILEAFGTIPYIKHSIWLQKTTKPFWKSAKFINNVNKAVDVAHGLNNLDDIISITKPVKENIYNSYKTQQLKYYLQNVSRDIPYPIDTDQRNPYEFNFTPSIQTQRLHNRKALPRR